jgi:hypothetical protein
MTLRASVLAAMLLALSALAITGSASATVLCTDSACATVYPAGTKFSASLKPGTSSKFTSGGSTIDTCASSSFSGKTSSESGASIAIKLETLTWGSCSQKTDTISFGSLSIASTPEGNGTVSGSGSQVTIALSGITCTYGTGTGTTLGTIAGEAEPVLTVSATLPRIAGGPFCPATVDWDAEYVIAEPHALFVEEVPDPLFRAEIPGIYIKGGPATLGFHQFFTGQKTVICKGATLTSINFVPPISSVVVAPVYSECTWGFNLPATVKSNLCRYGIGVHGDFTIQECAAKIEILLYNSAAEHTAGTPVCRYKIGNQVIAGRKVRFINAGAAAGRDVNFRFEVKGMAVEKVEGLDMTCGVTGNNGTYEGTTTMKAYDSAPPNAQVGWWRS